VESFVRNYHSVIKRLEALDDTRANGVLDVLRDEANDFQLEPVEAKIPRAGRGSTPPSVLMETLRHIVQDAELAGSGREGFTALWLGLCSYWQAIDADQIVGRRLSETRSHVDWVIRNSAKLSKHLRQGALFKALVDALCVWGMRMGPFGYGKQNYIKAFDALDRLTDAEANLYLEMLKAGTAPAALGGRHRHRRRSIFGARMHG